MQLSNRRQNVEWITLNMKHSLQLLISVIVSSSQVWSRSLCIRAQNNISPYQINSGGSRLARLVGRVSTEVTTQFMLELVSSSSGHSHLQCHNQELDSAIKDFERCVKQVQHSVRCAETGKGMCGWLQVFTNTCSGNILGRCLSEEATESLKVYQTTALAEHAVVKDNQCLDKDMILEVKEFARSLQQSDNIVTLISRKFPTSNLLRLGR